MTVLNKHIQGNFTKAGSTYDDVAQFQRATADNLLDRLDFLNIDPSVIVDLGTGTGYALKGLQQRYPDASLWGVDFAHGMIERVKKRYPTVAGVTADAHHLPFADRSVDVIFSNLLAQWSEDIIQLFKECRRVLRPGGVLLFSTLGPDTLKELRHAWASVDNHVHVHGFFDMHDWGDALLSACLLAPVVDRSEERHLYGTVSEILQMLKAIGASNVARGRRKGLMGKQHLARMMEAYTSVDGAFPVTYEVIYGIAWGPKRREAP